MLLLQLGTHRFRKITGVNYESSTHGQKAETLLRARTMADAHAEVISR